MATWLNAFTAYLRIDRQLRMSTIRIHIGNVKRLCRDGQITNEGFNQYLLNFTRKCKDDYEFQKLHNTLNRYIATFNAYADYLTKTGLKHDLVKRPYYDKYQPEIQPLTVTEIRLLLDSHVEYNPRNGMDGEKLDFVYHVVTHFILMTGARINETLEIRVSDLQLTKKVVRLRYTKSGKPRNAYLFEPVLSQLSSLSEGKKLDDYLFQNLKGGKVDDSSYRKHLNLLAQNAGINQRVHPHLLRHSFATILLQRGARLVDISDILGHSDINITKKIYVHLTDEEKRGAASRNPLVSSAVEAQELVQQRIDFISELEKDDRFDKTSLQKAKVSLLKAVKK